MTGFVETSRPWVVVMTSTVPDSAGVTDLDVIRAALERIGKALERLVALEERKVGSAKKILDVAARQQRELRQNLQLVSPDEPTEEAPE